MTIAISLWVNDGVVLATDSATTLYGPELDDKGEPTGQQVVTQVYNNARKVFDLCRGLPVGAITWGAAGIGPYSIDLLAGDLRARLSGEDAAFGKRWVLSARSYTVQDVARKLKTYMFQELHKKYPEDPPPPLGFLVGGYSAREGLPEVYLVERYSDGTVVGPDKMRAMVARGMPEAVYRLVAGVGSGLDAALKKLGVPEVEIDRYIDTITDYTSTPLHTSVMPIQDAIELCEFLVEATIKYQRFMPGAKTVGGPIEIAAITKYDGFKWIKRKQYYDRAINPEDRHEGVAQSTSRRTGLWPA